MDCNTHDCLFSFFNNVRGFWLNIIVYHKEKAYFATYTTMTYCLTSIVLMLILYKNLDFFWSGSSYFNFFFYFFDCSFNNCSKIKIPIIWN